MEMETKVAFVGPTIIHNALAQMDQSWDFQSPVESLDELNKEIGSENGKIAEDTAIIILFSHLYEANKNQFAEMAAFLAPYSAMIILAPSSEQDLNDEIREAIRAKQNEIADLPPEPGEEPYNPNTPFYFMDYEDPQPTLSKALSNYVRDPLANEAATQSILRTLPDTVVEDLKMQAETEESFEENEYEYSDSGKVIIPEADEDAQGKVITVTSSKGGSGKSTVSMLLAAYLAKGSKLSYEKGELDHPLKVLVFDFDTRDGQLGFLNGHQSPTIIDIVGAGDVSEESINKGIYHSPNMECDFIFSSKRPRYASQIPNEFFANVIQKLRSMYDYIILDTSVNYLDPLLDSIAYPIADQIVFVTDVGISSVFGMVRWLRETTQSDDENHVNIDPSKIGIVINKVLGDVNMDLNKLEKATQGRDIYAMLPSMPGLITYGANTSTLDQVLNQPIINAAIFNLVNILVSPQGYKIEELPSIK